MAHRRVGDHQLAVGPPNVLGELFPPPGGIDPDDDRPGECGTGEEEEVLGGVLEQHSDMERAVAAESPEERRPPFRLDDHLSPGPLLPFEAEPEVVVVDPEPDKLARGGDGRRVHVRRPARTSRTGLSSIGSSSDSPASRQR